MFLKIKNKKIDISNIEAIIFDMDGTLVESEHIWAYAKQKIAEDEGISAEVRKITVSEVIEAAKNGSLKEMFGAGTAAVISPISTFGYRDVDYDLPELENTYASKLKKRITDIQTNKAEDKRTYHSLTRVLVMKVSKLMRKNCLNLFVLHSLKKGIKEHNSFVLTYSSKVRVSV